MTTKMLDKIRSARDFSELISIYRAAQAEAEAAVAEARAAEEKRLAARERCNQARHACLIRSL